MNGYQLTFYTQQDRMHGRQSMAQWLLMLARDHGALGGTVFSGAEGFGHSGQLHSARFFELADQPATVVLVVNEAACASILEAIGQEAVDVFYVKSPVTYGRTAMPVRS